MLPEKAHAVVEPRTKIISNDTNACYESYEIAEILVSAVKTTAAKMVVQAVTVAIAVLVAVTEENLC